MTVSHSSAFVPLLCKPGWSIEKWPRAAGHSFALGCYILIYFPKLLLGGPRTVVNCPFTCQAIAELACQVRGWGLKVGRGLPFICLSWKVRVSMSQRTCVVKTNWSCYLPPLINHFTFKRWHLIDARLTSNMLCFLLILWPSQSPPRLNKGLCHQAIL